MCVLQGVASVLLVRGPAIAPAAVALLSCAVCLRLSATRLCSGRRHRALCCRLCCASFHLFPPSPSPRIGRRPSYVTAGCVQPSARLYTDLLRGSFGWRGRVVALSVFVRSTIVRSETSLVFCLCSFNVTFCISDSVSIILSVSTRTWSIWKLWTCRTRWRSWTPSAKIDSEGIAAILTRSAHDRIVVEVVKFVNDFTELRPLF